MRSLNVVLRQDKHRRCRANPEPQSSLLGIVHRRLTNVFQNFPTNIWRHPNADIIKDECSQLWPSIGIRFFLLAPLVSTTAKSKRQSLLTLRVSSYCLLALRDYCLLAFAEQRVRESGDAIWSSIWQDVSVQDLSGDPFTSSHLYSLNQPFESRVSRWDRFPPIGFPCICVRYFL